ncbi:multidrug effflux MFS transporter [Tropicimonas sp.]|uniref:multidrug effflux MFS transporter n=1 Tax=Tropicimonas sp. TaxID=2067044 RepID=UPI003A848495
MSDTLLHPHPVRRLPMAEFIAMMAMSFAVVAFSIDAMLPALPEIAAEISAADPNRAQLIITSFVLGMGIGTLFTGPVSDGVGRKPVIVFGAALYMLGAVMAWRAATIEAMFAARMLQGIGAAGPRVVGMAMIRDLYSGRQMARLMSFIMLVFTIVPALAPTIGAAIIMAAGWRAIFGAFILFCGIATIWLVTRQAETLPRHERRSFRLAVLFEGIREIFTNRVVVLSLAAQSIGFAILFSTISSTQQIFDETYGHGADFPLWFGGIALCSGTSGLVNAALVGRLGMRYMITTMFAIQVVISGVVVASFLGGSLGQPAQFAVYVVWTAGIFFQTGLTLGNLNALAMEPMGHLAGLTASVTGSAATVIAVLLAIPIGLAFDGTPLPLMIGTFLLTLAALAIMLVMRWMDQRARPVR